MAQIKKIIGNRFFPLIIFLLVLLLFFLNYRSGTFLSGWDNLHPEFNFLINIKRSLFAVWQEYQGLGLLGGMGHVSDFPRQIFLWVSSLILPTSFLRYFYHFLMLFLGPLGVYFLIKDILEKSSLLNPPSEESRSLPRHLGGVFSLSAFLGAIFYLFNLATIQIFYVPFEPFSHHFAFLPWLFLVNLKFLTRPNRKNLFWLFLVNFLAVPQGYVQTLFLVYLMALGFVFLFYWLLGGRNLRTIKNIILALLIAFLVNSFWLLPNAYFTLTNSKVVTSSKINQMATEDNLLKNKKYGNLANTAILKGFWFDNTEMGKDGKQDYQMGNWVKHSQNKFILTVGYLIFALSLLGVVLSLKKRKKELLVFLPVLIFSFTILSNNTLLFSSLTGLFYKIPLFSQIFRFPFTKFSILTAFGLAIFLAFGFKELFLSINNRLLKKFVFLVYVILPLIFCFPVFQGNLFYHKVKAKIPKEYFQVFAYFKSQPNGRIANFPQYTFWGWTFYDFNYSGSGLLWYGIKQPILDRVFDTWSPNNENYYHEISYAIYSKNLALFEKVLEKYQINWLLLDGNVVSFASPKSLYLEKLEELILGSSKISLVAQFGKIKIYQVNLENQPKDFVFLAKDLPEIGPSYKWGNYDKSFVNYGSYTSEVSPSPSANSFTSEVKKPRIYYPFRSLFTGRRQEELEFEIEETENEIIFKTKIPKNLVGGNLVIPQISEPEVLEIDEQDLTKVRGIEPRVYLDGELIPFNFTSGESLRNTPEVFGGRNTSEVTATDSSEVKLAYIKEGNLEVKVPKAGGLFSYNSDSTGDLFAKEPQSCDAFNKGQFGLEKIKIDGEEGVRFSALNQASCLDLFLPTLENRFAYLIGVKAKHLEGKSLLFWLENLQSRKADIETYLPKFTSEVFQTSYFIQPPMAQDGLGYSLHFNNISIGRVKSVNDLYGITVNQIPYKFLTGLRIVRGQSSAISHQSSVNDEFMVGHPNESFYKIKITNTQSLTPNTYLVLSQSYSKDWLAFQFNPPVGRDFLPHLLVNNWANGWKLEPSVASRQSSDCLKAEDCKLKTIYLFFWPQILEYLGFVLLLVIPVIIWRFRL